MRGSKRERRPGVWELRAYLGDGRQVSRTFHGSERAADKALNSLVSSVDRREITVSRGTVSDLLDEYVAQRVLAPSTLAVYSAARRRIADTDLGGTLLSRVTPLHVDRAYAAMRTSGASEYRMRQVHGLLKAAFRQGVRWKIVGENPMLDVRTPKTPKRRVEAPDPEQVRMLLEHLESRDPDLADLLLLACTTGMRRGALAGMMWADLDGDRLTLARSLVRVAGVLHVRPPKMRQEGEVEVVHLSPLEIAVLERVRRRQQERRSSAGMRGAGLWVLSKDGVGVEPRPPDSINNSMTQACQTLGLPRLSPHDLRHFMATTALANGVSVADVAARLHHSTPVITMRTYAHATYRGSQAIGDVVSGVLSPPSSPEPRQPSVAAPENDAPG